MTLANRKAAVWAVCAAAFALALGRGYSQMTGGGKTAMPARPLPEGITAPAIRFEDIAQKAGLTGRNVSGSETQQNYIVENTGNGVAIFDYDDDGLPDVFLVSADRFERGGPPAKHYLYRNLGGLRFEDVTAASGIAHTGWGQGVCAGDFDNDGRTDLFVTEWGSNHLWRNLGGGRFKDETAERGFDAPKRWSTGCAFFDYDRDGNLDLFVAHYELFDPARIPKPSDPGHCTWKGFPVVCGPIGLPPDTMSLYHNDGNGHFTDVTAKAGIGNAKGAGLTVLAGDFDNDGWPDVYVACDSTPSLYFRNRRDGTFEESGAYSALAYNEDGGEQSGMGATAGDYNHDGLLDIAKTNFADDIPNLYRNNGNHFFTETAAAAGLAIHTQFVSWGVGFLDFDNDGWKDLLIVNGHVYPDIDGRNVGQTFRQRRLLYWNRHDGQFFDMSRTAGPGILQPHSSRGLAIGDLDNNGDVEVVVLNMHEGPSLLKASGPAGADHAASMAGGNVEAVPAGHALRSFRREKGNAILVRALTAGGRDAIGARLAVTAGGMTQVDEVRSGGYYISQGDFRVHFGLGAAQAADVTVRWPGGKPETWRQVPANRRITIREGRGIVLNTALEKK